MEKCPICNREWGRDMEVHHLRPVTYSTRTKEVHQRSNMVKIHKMCHAKIHATFSEKDLLDHYHTVERLLEHDEMQKFVKWVKKHPPDYYDKNKQTNERKRKRKR